MTLKKINILEYAFGEGGGGHQKAYAVYAFINVDNCERPLNDMRVNSLHNLSQNLYRHHLKCIEIICYFVVIHEHIYRYSTLIGLH